MMPDEFPQIFKPQVKMTEEGLITEIYSAFEPFLPPPEGTYVNCEEVRGAAGYGVCGCTVCLYQKFGALGAAGGE